MAMSTGAIRRAEGFTLVSVLIALVMLVIGLLALARSQTSMVKSQSALASRTRAYIIARQAAEQLRAIPPATVASQPTTAVDSIGNPATGTGGFTRTITVTSDTTNLYRVAISVTYPGGAAPVQVTTLIYH
jgi:Tfp pilus assembly protein PilV